jgi:hypothetical protein
MRFSPFRRVRVWVDRRVGVIQKVVFLGICENGKPDERDEANFGVRSTRHKPFGADFHGIETEST